jgi:hypothetical protein
MWFRPLAVCTMMLIRIRRIGPIEKIMFLKGGGKAGGPLQPFKKRNHLRLVRSEQQPKSALAVLRFMVCSKKLVRLDYVLQFR